MYLSLLFRLSRTIIMTNKNIEKVSAYYDESFDSYSDFSDLDDSDADPDFSLPGTSQDSFPRAGPSPVSYSNK